VDDYDSTHSEVVGIASNRLPEFGSGVKSSSKISSVEYVSPSRLHGVPPTVIMSLSP
jgi:hypothetical protein